MDGKKARIATVIAIVILMLLFVLAALFFLSNSKPQSSEGNASPSLAVESESDEEIFAPEDLNDISESGDVSLEKEDIEVEPSSLSFTNAREDYPHLTDEQFANFRMISTAGIGEGTLFRTSSPVNPANNRNTYADAALRKAGVTTILNLADTQQAVEAFPGYADSYYATTNYICLAMGFSVYEDEFKAKLADGLRFLAKHEGPYALHCMEGKDRTGMVAGFLECFMGASLEEVERDYMLTFYNYYGVKPGMKIYEDIVSSNLHQALQGAFGVQDLENENLSQLAETFFRSIGLADDEIDALRVNLGKSYAAPAWLPAAQEGSTASSTASSGINVKR